MKEKEIKKIVKESYKKIAKKGCGCCEESQNDVDLAKSIGYTEEEISIAKEANLGLGCGNPTAFANIREGEIILDLGSGAGFDAFLALKKVGKSGKVIGIDMTEEMVTKASKLAEKYGYKNIEFKLGDIDDLPFENEIFDLIISNCVINLVPDKLKVFYEAYRVLKKNGRMYISDIVLLQELTVKQKNDKALIAGCVGGALLKDDYLDIIKKAGFRYKILEEDREISKHYNNINLESLKLELIKTNT